MTEHLLRVEATSSDGVPARIAQLLAQRRVPVRSLRMARRPGDRAWSIHLVVGLTEQTEVELLVKRLNRLIDVTRVHREEGNR